MNVKTISYSTLILIVSLPIGNTQEPIDYDPWGKGIVTEEEAIVIDQKHHAPIKLTLKVIGEDGTPVVDAECDVALGSRLHMDGRNSFTGKSDNNGMFEVEGRCRGDLWIEVTKPGYYPSTPSFPFTPKENLDFDLVKKRGFLPWNPLIVTTLKKVGKPIPMIVRWPNEMAKVSFPDDTKGQQISWDILKADWLPPHGEGEHGDLILSYNEDKGGVNIGNDGPQFYWHELNLRFANEHDGFLAIEELHGADSILKFPRIAPVEGYTVKEMTIRTEFIEPRISYSGNKSKYGYLMRFRTEVDDDGKVGRALYGKVTKPIQPGRSFNFHSYINPNWNDRNLEYDQTNNLAPELPERYKGVTWPP
jgi:hypothetical protein